MRKGTNGDKAALIGIAAALVAALGSPAPAAAGEIATLRVADAKADAAPAPAPRRIPVGKATTADPAPAEAKRSGPDTVMVTIDHAKVIRLPERSQTVIVGNPAIADVTVQKNGILVVTGKSYGVTNLIALDGTGTMLAESLIRVQAPSESLVTVQRGLDRESYSCTPDCQPSVLLGDAAKYFGEVSGQATQRNSLANPH